MNEEYNKLKEDYDDLLRRYHQTRELNTHLIKMYSQRAFAARFLHWVFEESVKPLPDKWVWVKPNGDLFAKDTKELLLKFLNSE